MFRWGIRFIKENRNAGPFYLLIDCFKPHEPWEAPARFYEMYGDPNYHGRTVLHTHYATIGNHYTTEEITNLKAHYSGLCTEVDYWVGETISELKQHNLIDNTLLIFTSDHGTNFGDNPTQTIGKPHYSMYPALMEIPLIIHFPGDFGAGLRFSDFVYNVYVPATIYQQVGVHVNSIKEKNKILIDGQSLRNLVEKKDWRSREYLT